MQNKRSATVSAILTVVVLILLAVISLLLQMVALNGAGERQGVTAMGISLACQGIVVIVLAILAARVTDFLIRRVSWNSILAVAVTVLVAAMIGGTTSFLSMILSIPIAGIR
jgi:membrane protease YdiL (CAAX protease family)